MSVREALKVDFYSDLKKLPVYVLLYFPSMLCMFVSLCSDDDDEIQFSSKMFIFWLILNSFVIQFGVGNFLYISPSLKGVNFFL